VVITTNDIVLKRDNKYIKYKGSCFLKSVHSPFVIAPLWIILVAGRQWFRVNANFEVTTCPFSNQTYGNIQVEKSKELTKN